MLRFSKKLPPHRELYSLGDLIYWHVLVYGTRPNGHPSAPFGQPWELANLAPLIGVKDRTLRNWMRDTNLPQEFDALLVELFGANKDFVGWRQELCDAYHRAAAKQPGKRGIWSRAQALVRVGGASEIIGKDNSTNEIGTGLLARFRSRSTSQMRPNAEAEAVRFVGSDEVHASASPNGAASSFGEPIDVEYEEILPQPVAATSPRSRSFVRRAIPPAIFASLALWFLASTHRQVSELLGELSSLWAPTRVRVDDTVTMIGTDPLRVFEIALRAGIKLRDVRSPLAEPKPSEPPKGPEVADQTKSEPPHSREPPAPPQPIGPPTAWRQAQDAEAERLASRTQAQADDEKMAAWDRQVQTIVDAGFTIHASETLTGEKLDRNPARTAADCARSCTGPSCTGWVFEDMRGLCDRYKGNVEPKPYGLGYTAGVRALRASSEDVLVPSATHGSLPIEKVQAPIASMSGPDGIARCASGSFKAPGFDVVCDRNLYGGGMLGRYPQRSPAASFNECADLCRSVSRCVVFTWEENARPPRTCHIFGPGGFQSNAAGGQISGFRCPGITDKRQLQVTGHISCPAP